MILDKIESPTEIKKLSYQELEILASEVRELIIKTTSENGGHIAPSLGVVELTIALHYAFDSPVDKIVWDVGHQCYAHKILTGRRDNFNTLRKKNGVAGFPKRCESVHDIIETGHSSTSISSATGLAVARDLKKEKNHVIAVIGDGALNGGLALEGLNNIGHLDFNRLIVILNDNTMSISPNVGAISNYLNHIRMEPLYTRFKDDIEKTLKKMPGSIGKPVLNALSRFKDGVRHMFVSGALFEALGFKYIGPVNGHDIRTLIDLFHNTRDEKGPLLIHVLTKKGKGYIPAENDPSRFHGLSPFNRNNGKALAKSKRTWTNAFSEKLISQAEKDQKIVAITAAMTQGTGLELFKQKFKPRFFDVGICEEHAVTFAAGLALEGLKPVVAIYSSFLQRSLDQIIHDVALQKAPVVFAIDRAGLVGEDGPTHHGVFDITYLRMIPGLELFIPADEDDIKECLNVALKSPLPVAIRYPRGALPIIDEKLNKKLKKRKPGTASVLKWNYLFKTLDKSQGFKIVIIAAGPIVFEATKAALNAENKKIAKVDVVKAVTVKPMDTSFLKKVFSEYNAIITCEENVLAGGFGSAVAEYACDQEYGGIIKRIGLEDSFVEQATLVELHELSGLDAAGILRGVKKIASNRSA